MIEARENIDPRDVPFYACWIYWRGRPIKLAIWNGIIDYECQCPLELLEEAGGRIMLVQVGKVSHDFFKDMKKSGEEDYDCLILWAKNTFIYRRIVDDMKLHATMKRDGTPLTKN